MHRWFRFCAGFALISFAGARLPVHAEPEVATPQAAVEEEDISQATPPPGKHQLRPTPMQIAEYRIELLSKRLAEQRQAIQRLTALTEEQAKKIETQAEEIVSLKEKVEIAGASVTALEGRMTEVTEAFGALKVQAAQTPQKTATPSAPAASESPILRAEPVAPKEREFTPEGGEIYTIKRGDNLTNIAKQHGTTVSEILRLNKIEDERKLQIGQKLILPKSSTPAPTPHE